MSIPQRTWHRVGHANAGDAVAVRYYPEDQSERNAFNCNQINGLSYHAYRQSQTVGFRTLDQPSAAVSHSVVTSLSTSRIGR